MSSLAWFCCLLFIQSRLDYLKDPEKLAYHVINDTQRITPKLIKATLQQG